MAYHALTLSKEMTGWLEAGVCDVPIDNVEGAARCEPGQPVRLLSPAGSLCAIGIADPENELVRVMALEREGFSSVDSRLLRARVQRALELRAGFGLARANTTHRLIHGAGDGLSGLGMDVYGEFGVVYAYSRGLMPLGRNVAQLLAEELGLAGLVLKLRGRDVAQAGSVKQEIIGASPPERLVVREDDAQFEVHLLSGLNVGLFTDMREHRAGLSRYVRDKRVLNTFSYTGSLSVAAARAGARSVTSIDLAAGVQKWARANFELNGLDASAHRFETGEVMRFVEKAGREGETYDLVIVDPPTVSAAKAGVWSMRKDYPELIARCVRLLPKGGLLWLSANSRELPPLATLARDAFARQQRSGQVLSLGGLPPDYPTLPAQADDRYLQVCLFRVF